MRKKKTAYNFFDTEHLSTNLAQKSVKGSIFTVSAQVLKLLLQIISNVFLARLLTPEDFGLIAMVSVVATFIIMFKDLGLSQAVVQQRDINHSQISTLFWINAVFGLCVMFLTILLSPAISFFYSESRLIPITITLAFGLFIGGLTVQHQALLRRQMKFAELATIDVLAMTLGVIAAIVSGFLGLGYWALVILQITTALITLVGVWVACSWKPGLPRRHSGVRKMLAFGGNMTIYGFINYFARNMDTVLIGWKFGPSQLGLYSRSYSLLMLPIAQFTAPFTGVAVPTLSRLQDDPERFRSYYTKAIKIIAYISMPFIVMMAVLSEEIVAIVLGKQWQQSAELFQVLAIASFWQPVCSTMGWLYVSLGNTRRMVNWGLLSTPVVIIGFLIGLNWGAYGVAVSYAISMNILLIPMFSYAFKDTPMSLSLMFKQLRFPLLVSFLAGMSGFFIRESLLGYNELTIIAGTLIASFLSVFGLSLFYRDVYHDVVTLTKNLKMALKGK